MRDVFALIFCGDLAQLDQLFRLRVKRRWINQRSANAKRACFHFLAHEFAHLIQLLRRRLLIFKADYVFANGGCTQEGSHIARDAAFLEVL